MLPEFRMLNSLRSEVTVADAILSVLPDGPQNDLAPEMAPLEVTGHGSVSKCTAYQRLPSTAASLTRTTERKILQQGHLPCDPGSEMCLRAGLIHWAPS